MRSLVLVLALMACGCVTPPRAGSLDVGMTEAALVASRGAPARSYEAADGSRVLTYVFRVTSINRNDYGGCETSFVVRAGVVVSSTASGNYCAH